MNFLAHFHLSHDNADSVIGSLLGDFVKGKKLDDYRLPVSQAIQLHRRIDGFTDRHPLILQSKTYLQPPYRRYAGIVVDILYDYFLHRHWSTFSDAPIGVFTQQIYSNLAQQSEQCPDHVKTLITRMRRYDWLGSYADLEGISRALQGVGKRLGDRVPLEKAIHQLSPHMNDVEQDFLNFYPLLSKFVLQEKSKQRPYGYNNIENSRHLDKTGGELGDGSNDN
ncbi:MAG: ACP phosphodiesterase [Gammaproteobacteria bacterium]|nr:ACP phosphodiesterase [Gammaproteobacteria bacterium]